MAPTMMPASAALVGPPETASPPSTSASAVAAEVSASPLVVLTRSSFAFSDDTGRDVIEGSSDSTSEEEAASVSAANVVCEAWVCEDNVELVGRDPSSGVPFSSSSSSSSSSSPSSSSVESTSSSSSPSSSPEESDSYWTSSTWGALMRRLSRYSCLVRRDLARN